MMKWFGMLSAIWIAYAIGKSAWPEAGLVIAFAFVGGMAGIGFVLGTIADR